MIRWLSGVICLAVCGVLIVSQSHARKPVTGATGQSELARVEPGFGPTDDRLVVHEWGTFTSYSGSDGGRLEFRPLFDDDLPDFVLDRSMGAVWFQKSSYRAMVRMETPVTYFYTREPRDVRVRVSFPQGLLTEFYPPVAKLSPAFDPAADETMRNSSLDWGPVRLIPEHSLRPALADERLAAEVQRRTAEALPPAADTQNHYAFARQTDSALVHVHRPVDAASPNLPHGDFFEKFLFYRGLGDFKLPIRVTAQGADRVNIQNLGTDPLQWLMLLDVAGDNVHYTVVDGVPAKGQREIRLERASKDINALAEELTCALTNTGLYRREAEAMVNTWRSSWFGETGTRLLYFVPQPLTDSLLPLEIEPRPAETIRVLVGRVDIMTPEHEQAVLHLVEASAQARDAARAETQATPAKTRVKFPLPDAILNLGRLAEPALTRTRHTTRNARVSAEATTLIQELQAEWSDRK